MRNTEFNRNASDSGILLDALIPKANLKCPAAARRFRDAFLQDAVRPFEDVVEPDTYEADTEYSE